MAPLVHFPLVSPHLRHCRPRQPYSRLLQRRLAAGMQVYLCMFRASKLKDTMRSKPTYPFPTLPYPLSAHPPFAVPLFLPRVCGRLCLLSRAQCFASL